ncbi:MAG: DUF948 domain-containing protein [Actinomycetota bacterium]|nr:DUF948 domain-containing protein [Actinomycetota bacterium]PLS75948.1 MAG: hypothetical protein CYG61_04585 [Actinomycetota bacterium]
MTAGEIAAVVVAVTSALLAVGLLFALSSLTRTLRTVRTTVEDLNRQSVPLLADLRATVETANAELVRVDELLGRAESIGGTLDSASRLAYLAFSNPIIKAMALGAGTSRAARRLRGGRRHRDD